MMRVSRSGRPGHRMRGYRHAGCLLLSGVFTMAQAQVVEIGDDGVARQVGPGWGVPREPPAPLFPSALAMPPARYSDIIHAAAEKYQLSPALLDAVARSESGYNAAAVSPAGAIGIMQLMPDTARGLDVDPRDTKQNIFGGAAYLRQQLDRFDGNLDLALAAYNAGGGRVIQYGGVPPFKETRAYVSRNLDLLAQHSLRAGDDFPAASIPKGDNHEIE